MLPFSGVLFVSRAGVESGAIASYNLKKRIEVVKNCRTIKKHDMKYNGEMPKMKVDPETYVSPSITTLRDLYVIWSTFG